MNMEFLSFYSVPLWLFSIMFVIFSLEVLNMFRWIYSLVFDISDGFQFSSVAQSCPTLCDPMDCSTPGFPGRHQLPELMQIHVHWVSDAIQPSHLLSSPFHPTFNLSQHQGFFPMSQFASGGQSIGVSASASVLPMNIQDWFPLGLTGLISLHLRDSQESSPMPQFKSITLSAFSLLYCPVVTSKHDYWKNQSFD